MKRGSDKLRSCLHKHFPTLLIALPQAIRSLPGVILVFTKRFRQGMTRRRTIAVGVVALVIGAVGLPYGLIELRRWRFESVAAAHESKMIYGLGCGGGPPSHYDRDGRLMTTAEVKLADWHANLTAKYRAAAIKPWLPVAPDPPPQ